MKHYLFIRWIFRLFLSINLFSTLSNKIFSKFDDIYNMTKTNFDLTYSPERIYPQIGNSVKMFFLLWVVITVIVRGVEEVLFD